MAFIITSSRVGMRERESGELSVRGRAIRFDSRSTGIRARATPVFIAWRNRVHNCVRQPDAATAACTSQRDALDVALHGHYIQPVYLYYTLYVIFLYFIHAFIFPKKRARCIVLCCWHVYGHRSTLHFAKIRLSYILHISVIQHISI